MAKKEQEGVAVIVDVITQEAGTFVVVGDVYFLFRQVATNTYLRPASTDVYVTPM